MKNLEQCYFRDRIIPGIVNINILKVICLKARCFESVCSLLKHPRLPGLGLTKAVSKELNLGFQHVRQRPRHLLSPRCMYAGSQNQTVFTPRHYDMGCGNPKQETKNAHAV